MYWPSLHSPNVRNSTTVLLASIALLSLLLSSLCTAHPTTSVPGLSLHHLHSTSLQTSVPSVAKVSHRYSATQTQSTDSKSHPTSPPCDPLPLSLPPRKLCDHIAAFCPSSGRLDYLHFFYCSSLGTHDEHAGDGHQDREGDPLTASLTLQRVLAVICITIWMIFLFSCLGLVASDFFCPNLGTISSRLGLNETTAGVTFLALGNGSPDVFSTFAAMSSGSGQLAIGELIGAASFIVSVVAGSMMLIKPFKVRPYPFLRDVGFFTVGVAATMFYLIDGKLTLGECLAMVALYLLYATVVIVGSLWEERKRRKRVLRERTRGNYANSDGESHDDDDNDETAPLGGLDVTATSPTPPRVPSRSHTPPNGTLLALETGRQAHQLLSPEYQPEPNDTDLDPSEVWGSAEPARGREFGRSNGGMGGDARMSFGRNLSTGNLEPPALVSPLLSPGSRNATTGLRPQQVLLRTHSKLRGGTNTLGALMPRHSLLGAVEFRDVIRSLEAAGEREGRSPGTDGGDGMRIDAWDLASSRDPEQFLPHSQHQHHHNQNHHRDSHGTHLRSPSLESGLAASIAVATASAAGPSVAPSLSPRPTLPRSASDLPNIGAASRERQPLLVRAGGIEDPWKEHGAGDGCEDVGATINTRTPSLPRLQIPEQQPRSGPTHGKQFSIPSIVVVSDADVAGSKVAAGATARHFSHPLSLTASLGRVLFPSLRHWADKSILGILLSVLNAPPLVVLTLTLPVVDDEGEARAAANALGGDVGAGGALTLKGGERDLFATSEATEDTPGPGVSVDEETILDLTTGERTAAPERERDPWKEEEERQLLANKQRDRNVASALHAQRGGPLDLTSSSNEDLLGGHDADAASSCSFESATSSHFSPLSANTNLVLSTSQCLLAPPFLTWVIVPDWNVEWLFWSFLFSSLLATSVLLLALRARSSGGYWYSPPTLAFLSLTRCFVGFCVSIAWISTVVNEVVAILQALGLICGLSDAILGLTIFAAGNSLADWVADVTIARAGYPIMAISACFAGPLLNLLLGIGLSGTYILSSAAAGGSPFDPSTPVYTIEISPTLLSSGAGLLFVLIGTLIVAPLNGFELGRKMGWGLIVAYSLVMAVNLAVEITGYGRRR